MLDTKTEGMYFGEQALISKDKKRTATIIANQDCHVAVISKTIFDQILSVSVKKAREKL